MTHTLIRVSSLLMAALCFLFADPASAALTGKIAGTLTDSESGGPLVGAAVVVQGTNIGTTTDADGRYFLLNIPPGTHAVEGQFIGYRSVVTEGVRVNVDRTVTVDFSLDPAAVAVEGVTVVAQREVIQLDVSGSQTILEVAELTAVPSKSVQEALALEPGVGVTGGIRGGGLSQTAVIVDGHLATDKRLNVPVMIFNMAALEEVQILTGGFNAEYGNARSGIINVTTRAAVGQPIWASATGIFYPAHKKFVETAASDGITYTAFGDDSWEWKHYGTNAALTTPIVRTNVDPENALDQTKWKEEEVFAGWNAIGAAMANPVSGEYLLEKWQWQHRAAAGPFKVGDYGDVADYVIDAAVGVPLGDMLGLMVAGRQEFTGYATPQWETDGFEDTNVEVRLNVRPSEPLRIDLSLSYGITTGLGQPALRGEGMSIARDFGSSINFLSAYTKYAVNSRNNAEIKRMTVGMNATYTVDQSSFAEFGVDYRNFEYNLSPGANVANSETHIVSKGPGLENDTLSAAPYVYTGARYTDGTFLNYMIGSDTRGRDSSDWNAFRIYGAYTNQIDVRNQLKIGVEATMTTNNQLGGEISVSNFTMQQWSVEPTEFAIYAQDRIEYEGMIANVGVRLDYFNSGGTIYEPGDPETSPWNLYSDIWDHQMWGNLATDFDIRKSVMALYGPGGTNVADSLQTEDATAKIALSPRLGISHPISKTTKVFFNYGHFYTVPEMRTLYGMYPNQPGSMEFMGSPDLEMPRTISYELGFDQEIGGEYLLHIAGYYKDATNQIAEMRRKHLAPSQPYDIHFPVNKQYADIRGFEAKFSKRVGQFVTGWINGGLQISKTTNLGFSEIAEDPNETPIPEATMQVAHRPQPYGKLSIDLHTPISHSAFGMPAIATGGWSLNWLTSYSRGGDGIYDPITTAGTPLSQAYVKSPNITYPDWWMTDVRISKGFSFGNIGVSAYMDILNLFDKQVFRGGGADYMASLHFPIDDPLIENQKGSDQPGDTPDYAVIPDQDRWTLYAYPRTFAFGIKVDF